MNYSYRKIALRTKLSKSTVFDIAKNEEQRKNQNYGKQEKKSKGGRPELLTAHDKRKLHLSFKRGVDPNLKEVVQNSGIALKSASYRTFVRYIKKMGYGFYASRNKGVMTTKDFKQPKKIRQRDESKKF